MNIQEVKISAIKANPNNPRICRDDKFAKLVQSIRDFPEMLRLRPIVVNDDMIVLGGNIPGKTQVVSTQIYGYVEAMEYTQAHWLAGGMVVFSFAVLIALSLLKKRTDRVLG